MLGTLRDFVFYPGCGNGLVVDDLAPGTRVLVRTKNSCYHFDLMDEGRRRASVVGGRFVEPCDVRIEGSTAGGSVIKAGWIGVGLHLELAIGRKRITTSSVESVTVESVS